MTCEIKIIDISNGIKNELIWEMDYFHKSIYYYYYYFWI